MWLKQYANGQTHIMKARPKQYKFSDNSLDHFMIGCQAHLLNSHHLL